MFLKSTWGICASIAFDSSLSLKWINPVRLLSPLLPLTRHHQILSEGNKEFLTDRSWKEICLKIESELINPQKMQLRKEAIFSNSFSFKCKFQRCVQNEMWHEVCVRKKNIYIYNMHVCVCLCATRVCVFFFAPVVTVVTGASKLDR